MAPWIHRVGVRLGVGAIGVWFGAGAGVGTKRKSEPQPSHTGKLPIKPTRYCNMYVVSMLELVLLPLASQAMRCKGDRLRSPTTACELTVPSIAVMDWLIAPIFCGSTRHVPSGRAPKEYWPLESVCVDAGVGPRS